MLSACSTWPCERGAGADQRHRRPQHPLKHGADQRVVGAAEDDRVDVCTAERLTCFAHRLERPLVELVLGLDDRARASGTARRTRVDIADRPPRPPPRRRRWRRSSAWRAGRSARSASRHRAGRPPGAPRRAHPRPASSPSSAGAAPAGRRRVAELQATTISFALRAQELLGDLAGEARRAPRRALAVGEASGVAQVEKVLMRQLERAARAARSARRRRSRTRRSAARARRRLRAAPCDGAPSPAAPAASIRSGRSSTCRPSFQSATVGGSCARSSSPTCSPTPPHPERGQFVRDQVAALRPPRRGARGGAVRVPPGGGARARR